MERPTPPDYERTPLTYSEQQQQQQQQQQTFPPSYPTSSIGVTAPSAVYPTTTTRTTSPHGGNYSQGIYVVDPFPSSSSPNHYPTSQGYQSSTFVQVQNGNTTTFVPITSRSVGAVENTKLVPVVDRVSALAHVFNFFWIFIGGGLIMYLIYVLCAMAAAVTIAGWPIARDIFTHAHFILAPYGRGIKQKIQPQPCTILFQIFWFPFGACIYLSHIAFCIIWLFSIVGIPFALQHFRLARFALWPSDYQIYYRRFECQDTFNFISYVDDQIECCASSQTTV